MESKGYTDPIYDDVAVAVHRDDAIEGRLQNGAVAGFSLPHVVIGALGHFAENQHHRQQLPARVRDRSERTVDVALRAVFGDADGVLAQAGAPSFLENPWKRDFDRPARPPLEGKYQTFYKAEIDKWAKVIKGIGLALD